MSFWILLSYHHRLSFRPIKSSLHASKNTTPKPHWISSQLLGDSDPKTLRMMNFQSLMHTRKPPFVMLSTPSLTDRTVTISTFKYAQCSSFRTSLNPLTALFKRPKNPSFKVIIACELLYFLDIFQWFKSHFCGSFFFSLLFLYVHRRLNLHWRKTGYWNLKMLHYWFRLALDGLCLLPWL